MTTAVVETLRGLIEKKYYTRANAFEFFCRRFECHVGVPASVTRRAIKYTILKQLTTEPKFQVLRKPLPIVVSFGGHLLVMIYLLFCSVFSPARQNLTASILFEVRSLHLQDFYEPILRELGNKNVVVFGKHHRDLSSVYYRDAVQKCDWLFDRKISRCLLLKNILNWRTLRRRSLATGVDLNLLQLMFLIDVLRHKTTVSGINAPLLVSADDAGYPPLRHWAYTDSGIGKVALIQNGGRVELNAHYNNYVSCDLYFAWSKHRHKHVIDMSSKKTFFVGSLRLSKFLKAIDNTKVGNSTDILFMEQIYPSNSKEHSVFVNILSNLIKFADENGNLRVGYALRPDRLSCDGAARREIDELIHASSVHVLESNDESKSYGHMLKTVLLLAYDSSIRVEAIAMGIPAASCSDGAKPQDYVAIYSPQKLNVENLNFADFSSQLIQLVSMKDSELKELVKMQQKYLSFPLSRDTAHLITTHIKSALDINVH